MSCRLRRSCCYSAPSWPPLQTTRPAPCRNPGAHDSPIHQEPGKIHRTRPNPLAQALYSDLLQSRIADWNNARFTFLDPLARDFYVDWEQTANDVVAVLRGYVGANPADRRLSQLVGELVTRSDDFSRRWAVYDVKYHRTGRKVLRHRVVGDLDLGFEALALPDSTTLSLSTTRPTSRLGSVCSCWRAGPPPKPATASGLIPSSRSSRTIEELPPVPSLSY
ncbi:hypothetical protein ACLVWQ_27510 [Streptomyces sp. CWNU-52B]|uniref:MmyB family transcriptional regulator n=1 Tax=unclassified Streptomyces TaxID=2593676 RepID=UPI0039C399C3